MKLRLPAWLTNVLGLPGAVSFRRFEQIVRCAGQLGAHFAACPDEELRENAGRVIPAPDGVIVPDDMAVFLAIAREFSSRTVGLRPFDEQLLACCALISGHAVELDTGEGKTLVGAIAAIGQVASGRRVHVVSVNDYLAERDATWMRPLFAAFDVKVDWVGQRSGHDSRRASYTSDVVYAAVSEVGFDVLRDRFAVNDEDRVAPVFDVAIVDEADAVLIDEAMVPLVLAGTDDAAPEDFAAATALVAELLVDEHFEVDAERANATLTDAGLDLLERRLGGIDLYTEDGVGTLTRLTLALQARAVMHRDVDYLVQDGAIVLINASRGRIASLQRWPDGLHAAIEAKEGLPVSPAGVVLDTMTVHDLVLRYRTLSGMSGTVGEVAEELLEFFRLSTGRVQRHVPDIRTDEPLRVLVTQDEKYADVVRLIVSVHTTRRPILVGTQSVAESEELAALLESEGMTPRVLNAKNDADEAAIIASAGELGAVTISTQMSGRGTDIRLGGADESGRDEVVGVGGLLVVLTSRFPSKRLDAQLRGRAGRQGDPGGTVSFAALDDELVETTVPVHIATRIDRHGTSMAMPVRRQIVDEAQSIADALRRDRHRSTWEYARAIAAQRETVLARREEVATLNGAVDELRLLIPEHIARLEAAGGRKSVAELVRGVVLYTLDDRWREHLAVLAEVRDGIHLRALGGDRPVEEFHKIALRQFNGFLDVSMERAASFVASIDASSIGGTLDDLGLRRPSSTWTYLVTDDPFGSPGDRFARGLGKRWRTSVARLEP
ncbi:accessory Sec system translocase SecA2 [Plantibacter sp. Mn2098]|uniref:accessory Sec system translocase SecA2 n=1 Tax=Plantibacter sp. Mn2098 TaxID=3395266 RepID=UPI003BCC64FD